MTLGPVYKVEAIVLARKNSGEADRILTIFTKQYGKLRSLAKGIRRLTSRRAPHAEIFSRVTMMLRHSKTNLDLVGEIEALGNYQNLRKDLHKVSTAYYICELVDRLLPEKQEHRDVYELLKNNLDKLNELDLTRHSRESGNPSSVKMDSGSKAGMTMEAESSLSQLGNQFAIELLRLLGFLRCDKTLKPEESERYIESLIERRLRTPKIIRQISK